MSKVVFSHNKRESICEQLQQLKKDSEVNVHVGKNTYYNAQFKGFSPRSKKATFLIDRFYKGGNKTITFKCNEITSIDFPLTSPFASKNKEDDVE